MLSMNALPAPSWQLQVGMLGLAAGLVALGVWGGQYFMENDYVVYGVASSSKWTTDAGYTEAEFWGLVLQVLCLPAAAVALVNFGLHSYKSTAWPAGAKFVMYVVLLMVLVSCAVIAALTMTDGLVSCLWRLCLSSDTSSTSDSFTAFIPTVGTLYFCSLLIMAGMAFLLALRTGLDLAAIPSLAIFATERVVEMDVPTKAEAQPLVPDEANFGTLDPARRVAPSPNMYTSLTRDRERRETDRVMSRIWLGGIFCVFFPLFIFESMAIGDSWLHLTVSGLKSYASSSVTQAYGTVWNIWLSSDFILKLYPDILIYWSFIYLIASVGLLAKRWHSLRRFLHSQSTPLRRWGWTNGEALLVLWFGALLLAEGLYWYLDHGWHSESISDKTCQERFARTMGQLANVTMGIMILPVTRNGVFQKVFGVGWESMICFHRRMARVFLSVVILHMVFFWVVYAQNDTFWHDWPIAIPMDYNSDNWTVPLSTLSTWVMVVLMFGFSLDWVRRKYFELFYYSHHYFMVVWIVMLWHAASAWYYIVASLTLWVLDRAIRFSRGLTTVSVTGMTTWGGVTRLSYRIENGGSTPCGGKPMAMKHEAGQYAFINVPAISALQWHPFTISSSPGDTETTHHIQDMGEGTFTGKLRMLGTLGNRIQVNVDGPYGAPVEYDRYRLLVLVAGGIGITPCISIFRHLNLMARAGGLTHCLDEGVRLIWTTRSMEHFVMMEKELQDMEGEECSVRGRFSVHLHLTAATGGAGPWRPGTSAGGPGLVRTCLPHTHGRPNLSAYLGGYDNLIKEQKALVFACGPAGLTQEASRVALDAGMDFHSETFEL